ncbi:MAG: prepilin peptidase [Dehalococcoidia bacterium]
MTSIALFALLGLAVGSFLNVCCDRLPLRQSIISPPSHCGLCGKKLKVVDLVPIFSYLWLRGHCRYCGARIPLRLPLLEVGTALLFALLCWHYGLGPQLPMALIYACIFLVVFVIDLEHGLILDIVVYPGMVLALIFSFFWPELGWPGLGVLSALLGGAIGFGLMLVPYLISGGGMGGGDVKLAGLIGLAIGFPYVLIALFTAIITAGVLAIALVASRRRSRKQTIPFGPFLAAAAMVALVWGHPIADWVIGIF